MAAVFLLFACAGRQSTQFYLLETLNQQPLPMFESKQKRSIGIGPVTLPTLLERKQIVTRAEDNSIQLAEFHQWASPLKDNVMQVLTHNLTTLQTSDIIRSYPWSAFGTVNYHIIIDITRFDTRPGQSVNFQANWAIMDDKTHTLASSGLSRIEHPLADTSYPATVDALSKVLGEFSKELSLAVGRIK